MPRSTNTTFSPGCALNEYASRRRLPLPRGAVCADNHFGGADRESGVSRDAWSGGNAATGGGNARGLSLYADVSSGIVLPDRSVARACARSVSPSRSVVGTITSMSSGRVRQFTIAGRKATLPATRLRSTCLSRWETPTQSHPHDRGETEPPSSYRFRLGPIRTVGTVGKAGSTRRQNEAAGARKLVD